MDNLDVFADIASTIAAITGALALIPVLTPIMGPIALASGAAAVGLRSADMSANDRWDEPGAWVSLGADGLSSLPLVGPVARGGKAAATSLRGVDGLTPALSRGGETFVHGARAAAEGVGTPARGFRKLGENVASLAGGNADTLARVSQGAAGLTPVGMDLTGMPGSEYAAVVSAGAQSTGNWGPTGQSFSDLGSELANFAAEVGR